MDIIIIWDTHLFWLRATCVACVICLKNRCAHMLLILEIFQWLPLSLAVTLRSLSLRICISNRFLGHAVAVHPGTTLGDPLACRMTRAP